MCQRDLLRLLLSLGLSLASILFVHTHVSAQAPAGGGGAPSAEARKEASLHFSRGVELFEEGAFRAALVEFERAYAIAPDYRLLYNIGHAHNELHDYLGATQSYERYLADGGSAVNAERRREVESMLSSLAGRVARLSIHTNIASAEVFVDDQRAGVAPLASTIPVNVGRHRVFARTASGFTGEKLVDVAGGDLTEVNLELTSPTPQASGQPLGRSTPADDEARTFAPLQKAAIASWVLVAPLAAAAIATGVVASQKADDRDDLLKQRPVDAALKDKAGELRDSARTLALASDCLTAASVLVAATGVVLWFQGKRHRAERRDAHSKPRAVALDVGFGTARLVGQF